MSRIFDRDTDVDTTEHILCSVDHDHPADGLRDGRALCSTHAAMEGQRLTPGEVFKLHRAQLEWAAR